MDNGWLNAMAKRLLRRRSASFVGLSKKMIYITRATTTRVFWIDSRRENPDHMYTIYISPNEKNALRLGAVITHALCHICIAEQHYNQGQDRKFLVCSKQTHNTEFQTLATSVGLIQEDNYRSLSPDGEQVIKEILTEIGDDLESYVMSPVISRPVSSWHDFLCPKCHYVIGRVTKDLYTRHNKRGGISCLECGTRCMIRSTIIPAK